MARYEGGILGTGVDRMAGYEAFANWEGLLADWQADIRYPVDRLGDFLMVPKYDESPAPTIGFGAFQGQPKWRSVRDVPTQPIRDALLDLLRVQGDTEFASVEQQRHLLDTAPSDYDAKSLVRINAEEMRHGLQMAHILTTNFGDAGKREAAGLLERRATKGTRLLKAFNDQVRHWVDLFCFTAFMDRDGKYQLAMLHQCAFWPIAASMGPMLKEEAFHLGTGVTGLKRIVQAGVIPTPILQKYVNWWVSAAYDCFGKEQSGTAAWAYTWGLKGRFDELTNPAEADRFALNQHNRALYAAEVHGILEELNRHRAKGQVPLFAPDVRFHRRVGDHVDACVTAHGQNLPADDMEAYLAEALPSADDEEHLAWAFGQDWISTRGGTP